MQMDKNRFFGTIYGQAIGDALGLGSEFMTQDEVKKFYPDGLSSYDQIVQDDHRCRWVKGSWTDDTDMMLCIMDAIIANNGVVDLLSIAANFKKWFNGNPRGIGRHTYNVLCMEDYEKDPIKNAEMMWTLYRKRSEANGGVMRTSVVGLVKDDVEKNAENVCLLTHPDRRCVCSAVIVSKIINQLVYHNHELTYDEVVLCSEQYDSRALPFLEIAKNADDISELQLDGLDLGYTLKTLSAGLWALWHCKSFEEGLLAVVNAGGDADTNAAVACSLLGAKYGYDSIPDCFIQGLNNRELIHEKTESLCRIMEKKDEIVCRGA